MAKHRQPLPVVDSELPPKETASHAIQQPYWIILGRPCDDVQYEQQLNNYGRAASQSRHIMEPMDVDDDRRGRSENRDGAEEKYGSQEGENEQAQTQRSRFRFKSAKRKPDHRGHDRDRHKHLQSTHRSKRQRSEPPDEPSLRDESQLPNTSSGEFLDPDALFRESLFDAMADDEGAQFWEGVYGQPIPKIDPVKMDVETGKLEAMTDDEYAAHIRAEMYKKTHQHLIEEKERRDRAKKEQAKMAEEARKQERESEAFRRQVEESLKRGRERKDKAERTQGWSQKWAGYQELWEVFRGSTSGAPTIPWPVWSGRIEDLGKDEVEAFFLNGPTAGKPDQADLVKTLKLERVRWHPDKVQQKLGGHGVDEAKMQGVTQVFQIVDRMWNEMKSSGDR
ncbi:hypothetical protein V500_04785 [Pseudogymnoascus sp. VKM F-4518 (FW-2643)]|nr:hypothetical protein V500_04785 [Pseudogymnoascus sp. VKM F-4518 (FW-2643)]